MSDALPGEHLCTKHQGNTSHYDKENCTICRLRSKYQKLKLAAQQVSDNHWLGTNTTKRNASDDQETLRHILESL